MKQITKKKPLDNVFIHGDDVIVWLRKFVRRSGLTFRTLKLEKQLGNRGWRLVVFLDEE